MAKYKVLKDFRLLENQKVSGVGEIVTKGTVIDITAKRAAAVEKNLDSSYLERLSDEK
ncbi:hypothetical protein A5819_003789 [Enterococcus sp. 7E2_DIV0204]|uniref:hypothetical protein n=1 Tax=unclassified Enterococcus TaxID=2608891 RepID=UPI000B6FF38A|nr:MULTISPECIES: hypothetical protein [unclassified Enterococcus]OTN83692.1 hypothetical protein A5819_003789 [Enterococcus sp. 7E2_DIV0204]OTP53075.1 hypothetical protein A5884_002278 [Enterococcus sp. 7D2_DIV0200]